MKGNILGIFEYIRRYGTKSIHLRNLIIIATITTLPIIVLSKLLFNITAANINNEVSSSNITILEKNLDSLDTEFNKVMDMFMLIAGGMDLNSLAIAETIDPLNYNSLEKIRAVTGTFGMAELLNPNISDLFVYFTKSDAIIDSRGGVSNRTEYRYSEIINTLKSMKPEDKRKNIHFITDSGDKDRNYFAVVFERKYGYLSQDNAIFVVIIDESAIKKIISPAEKEDRVINFLLDLDGGILTQTKEISGSSVINEVMLSKLKDDQGFYVYQAEDEQKVWVYVTSKNNLWKLVSEISVEFVNSKLNFYKKVFIISFVCIIIVAGAVSLIVTGKLSEPVNMLLSLIDNKDGWIDEERISKIRFAEVKFLGSSMLKPYKENEQLKNSLEERIRILKKAQIKALQYQINPHFLYNTLDSINWAIREKLGMENIPSEMINSLSEFLAFSLEYGDNLICIRSEIENLAHYIKIQKFRRNSDFEVVWDIPDSLFKYKMIKLSLQPLIENALSHGIKRNMIGGVIKVSGKIDNNIVDISVEDNGAGMDCNKLKNLLLSLEDMDIETTGSIGLKNVNLRHKILFGEQFGLIVESIESERTKVRIRFPCIPLI